MSDPSCERGSWCLQVAGLNLERGTRPAKHTNTRDIRNTAKSKPQVRPEFSMTDKDGNQGLARQTEKMQKQTQDPSAKVS